MTTVLEVIYVSTDLRTWVPENPMFFGKDVTMLGVTYRRMDAEYYAWLRHKLTLAKTAKDAGWLAESSYETLLHRFDEVHEWCLVHLGREQLVAGVGNLVPTRYGAPAEIKFLKLTTITPPAVVVEAVATAADVHVFPADGDWPFTHTVSKQAVAIVDAHRDEAVAKGWTLSALYQNRSACAFPTGPDYGLVCFVGNGTAIRDVKEGFITIEEGDGTVASIYNPHAEHTWCRRM